MNKYESVIIINPSIEEQAIKDLVTKFTDLINNNGKVESVDERGTQKLAYPIKKKEEGYYVVINFEAKQKIWNSRRGFIKRRIRISTCI